MILPGRARWWLVLGGLGLAGPLRAQLPYDSLPADTLMRDTVNTTEKYLAAQSKAEARLPVLPQVGTAGPRPAMSRVIFTRDSMDWAMAETVGDLLQRVPGVYLWRGGWLGRTEYPDYRGRGPSSVEYRLDGLPYLPIGPDSLGVDPSFFSLSLYQRVEIERWPGGLRVHLFTRRHDRQAPGSRVGITSGDKQIARYIGFLHQRYSSGLGFGLGGERMVAPTATGDASDFDITNVWAQVGYVPDERFGVEAELVSSHPDRKAYIALQDTLELRTTGKRNDAQLRVFWRSSGSGQGLSVNGILGRTRWDGSGVTDKVRQGGVELEWRSPTLGLMLHGFNRSRITPWDLQARGSWAPIDRFAGEVEAGYQKHDGDRRSTWLAASGSLTLPLGLDLQGTLRQGSIVSAPALLAQSSQSLTDWQLTARWERPWVGLEGGYGRTDGFRPVAFRSFTPTVAGFATAAPANWVTVGWRLSPRRWLSFQGWYSDPAGKHPPDGIPATHSLTTATIRSKFWRTFRSGIFDFKAQLGYESWGDGVIGRDSTGAPIALEGASFWRTAIEIQIASVLIYWDRYNLQASRKSYVPGFRLLNFGSTFGVRWEFLN